MQIQIQIRPVTLIQLLSGGQVQEGQYKLGQGPKKRKMIQNVVQNNISNKISSHDFITCGTDSLNFNFQSLCSSAAHLRGDPMWWKAGFMPCVECGLSCTAGEEGARGQGCGGWASRGRVGLDENGEAVGHGCDGKHESGVLAAHTVLFLSKDCRDSCR